MRAWRPRHPWPESVGRRLTGAFGVLLVLILAVAVTGFVGLVATARASAQYDRLEGAVDANRAALQAMTDAETGVRGYRLAQRTEFLDPYWDGTDRFSGHIASLRQLAEDVAVEPLVARQVRAAAAWQDAVGRPVSRMQSGKAALPHGRVVAGKQAFDEFRDANASAGVPSTAPATTRAATVPCCSGSSWPRWQHRCCRRSPSRRGPLCRRAVDSSTRSGSSARP